MASNYIDLPTSSGGSAGVSSLNGLNGALTLVAGTGITITPSGNSLTIASTSSGGTVTSVGLVDSTNIFNITGSPVTTSGSLTLSSLKSQAANTFLAAPNGSSGAPTFRLIVAADIPTLNQNTTGNAATVTTNANLTGPVTSVGNATAIANGAISNAMLANGAVANLSGTNTGNVTLTAVDSAPNANGASLSGQILTLQPANASFPGVLLAADWNTFNGKQNSLTFGNLTDAGTDGITITGGTGAVIGSGTTISQHIADSTHNGYLSAADWSTFNNKLSPSFGNYITNPDAEVNTAGWNLYNNQGNTAFAFVVAQDITFTAVAAGSAGNGINIDYIFHPTQSYLTPLVTVVSSTHVTVAWYNGPTIANNPTATQLKAAWDAVPGAVALATSAITGIASNKQYQTGANITANGGDTTPINGTGGSVVGVTFTRNTSTPLVGTASFDLGKDAANRQGEGVSTDFIINSLDKGNQLQISFAYQGSSGMVLGANSDVQVFIYDITNATLIPVTPLRTIAGPVSTAHTFVGKFQSVSTSVSYRLILHIATTSTTAWDLLLDSVTINNVITPGTTVQVPSLVLPAQPISGAVTDHMVVMWQDSSTHWVPATIAGAALPVFGDDVTQLGFATNIVGSVADIYIRGSMGGFSFGPFTGYEQYIDNVAGGISPLPSPFNDMYVTVGMAINSTTLNIQFNPHVDLIANSSGVPLKGGLLSNSAVNDGTGDQVLTVGTNGNVLVANSAASLGINWAPAVVAGSGLTYTTSTRSLVLGTAGVLAIANGGTGQTTANTAFNALSPMTTAGDMIYENATPIAARLPIGTTGQVLTVSGGLPVWTNAGTANSAASFTAYFGNGSDGNLTIASGITTLTRDMYYNNLTINGTGQLKTAGYKVFVAGILDLSAAPAAAIVNDGGNGGNGAASVTGGTAGAAGLGVTVGVAGIGGVGGAGATGAGVQAAAPAAVAVGDGGASGAGGAGGTGTSAGGALRAGAAVTAFPLNILTTNFVKGVTLISGGAGGAGGSGGGGDGTVAGGGGGGGGGGGSIIPIYANTLNRSGSTASSAIHANGGTGGNGGSPATGNSGGGGGAGAGGGGWIYFVYNTLTGSTGPSDMIAASGGTGGNGGNGSGTAQGGNGGTGGSGGRITLINFNTGVITETFGSAGTIGNLHSGATGGTGGAGNANTTTL